MNTPTIIINPVTLSSHQQHLHNDNDDNTTNSHTTGVKINYIRQKAWGQHTPVVSAMLKGNRRVMSNCDEVREVFAECLKTHSSDQICKTAASYFRVCVNNQEKD